MTDPARRSRRCLRLTAALSAVVLLMAATPMAASAEDQFWGLWAREVTNRVWWERPFAVIVSFPAMVVTTPFWGTTKLVGAIGGDDD